jgi:hypothetical protein
MHTHIAGLPSDAHFIDGDTRDLTPLAFTADGQFRILGAERWRDTTQPERSALAVRHAMYVLPTTELVERLREVIAGRRAIEIGSGNGVLAAALGIPATDNWMQERARYLALYAGLRQPTIRYGANVERLDAHAAIAKHRPQVVVAAWVTHRYDPRRPDAGGNEIGVVEEDVIDDVETYILVGNSQVHRHKSIWSRPHTIENHDYLLSRALGGGRDFIAVWNRSGA